MTSSRQSPEEARVACVAQLRALSGCAKGLTNNLSPLAALGVTDEEEQEIMATMEIARADPLMVDLRSKITLALRLLTSIWSADAEVGEVCPAHLDLRDVVRGSDDYLADGHRRLVISSSL